MEFVSVDTGLRAEAVVPWVEVHFALLKGMAAGNTGVGFSREEKAAVFDGSLFGELEETQNSRFRDILLEKKIR